MENLIQYCTRASLYDGPFDSVVGWAAAGMGYVLVGKTGELVVIDGGNREDAEAFLELLEGLSEGRPVIRRWIITHPHMDHYGALYELCGRSGWLERFRVEELIYHFPEEFCMTNGADCSEGREHLRFIEKMTGAVLRIPSEGDVYETDGIQISMLFTPEDCSELHNPNELSLIFMARTEKKRILFTGDAYRPTLRRTVQHHGSELACDILQLPHHGLCDTGDLDFYKAAGAKTVLVPISVAGDRTMASDMYGASPEVNRFARRNAETVIAAWEGTTTISLR